MKKLLVVALVVLCVPSALSLTIVSDFGGITPTNTVGSGNWTNICRLACKVWETAFPGTESKLVLHFRWDNSVPTARHELQAQSGAPNRETEGTILINGNPWFKWFLDSDPLGPAMYTQVSINLGGGQINASRYRSEIVDQMSMDLFTVVLHEIGHSLGLSMDNTSFSGICSNGSVTVCNGQYAGTVVPFAQNNYGFTSHIADITPCTLMSGLYGWCQRALPSALDIVVLGQLSGLTSNPELRPVLSIGRPQNVAGRPMPAIAELSWLEVMPPPSGMKYKVQTCTDVSSGNWASIGEDSVVINGVHTQLVPTDKGASFFRLTLETE